MEALDFRIHVGDRVEGGYRLTVTGPDDEFTTVVPLDFDDPVLATKLSYLPVVLQSSSAPSRATSSMEEQEIQFIGARLFRRLMADETLGMLARARRTARDSGRDLRLTLRIRPPELARLPWEFLFDERPDRREYLGRQCLLVRDSEDLPPVPPLTVHGPLRILAMVADVNGLPRLDIAAERAGLEHALADLTASGQIGLHWADATKPALISALRKGPWHVFHFIGHGVYDQGAGEGRLVFVAPDGGADHVSARQLAATFGTHPTLRLAVFNACETGTGGADPHSSVAAAMIHGGLPAIVGMQFPITDLAAPTFGQAFYEALADGAPVDRCVQAGRTAIWLGNDASLEWGTPVLYQRSADGRIFVLEDGAAAATATTSATDTAPVRVAEPEATRSKAVVVEPPPATAFPVPAPVRTGPADDVVRAPAVVRRIRTDHKIASLALTPHGSLLAVGCEQGIASVHSLGPDQGATELDHARHPAVVSTLPVTRVAFDTRRAVVCCSLGSPEAASAFAIWRFEHWELMEHEYGVTQSVAAPDGVSYVLTVANGQSFITATDGVAFRAGPGLGLVTGLDISPDGRRLAATGADGLVRIWDTHNAALLRVVPSNKYRHGVAFTPEGGRAVYPSESGQHLRVLDISEGDVILRFPTHPAASNFWALSSTGVLLFQQPGYDSAPELVHVDGRTVLGRLAEDKRPFTPVRPVFSADGRFLAAAVRENEVKVWDVSALDPFAGSAHV